MVSESPSELKDYKDSALFQDQVWFTGLLTGGIIGNGIGKT